jgi:hypothetical protein
MYIEAYTKLSKLEETMEQLKGRLYIVPIKEEGTSILRKDDDKLHARSMISELLGLERIPEKWVRVHALDEQNRNETDETIKEEPEGWKLREYGIQDSPAVIFFPRYLPASLFEGKKENDTITLSYAGLEILLTLKQVPYRYGNHGCFEEVFAAMAADDVSYHSRLETPIREREIESEGTEKPEPKMPKWAVTALCLAGGIIVFGIGVALSMALDKEHAAGGETLTACD